VKLAAQILLIILLVPLLFLGVLAFTFKFQLLNSSFWINALEKGGAYSRTSSALKTYFEQKIEKEGGRAGDARVLTDLITPENLKDITEKNITNLLSFANAQNSEPIIYLPVKKIPRGLLPKEFATLPENIPLPTLLSKFNIAGVDAEQIRQFSSLGRAAGYFLVLDLVIAAIFLLLLILLTEKGKRLVAPAIALFLTSMPVFALTRGGAVSGTGGSSPAEVIALNLLPPVFGAIGIIWIIIGFSLIGLGVVLLFLKK
jgi:hypothetical protein